MPMTYSQKYPNYYDSYQAYLSGGGLVTSAPSENCGHSGSHSTFAHSSYVHGGFGYIGSGHSAGS